MIVYRKELGRLQEEQVYFVRKIEKEKMRKETLERSLEVQYGLTLNAATNVFIMTIN